MKLIYPFEMFEILHCCFRYQISGKTIETNGLKENVLSLFGTALCVSIVSYKYYFEAVFPHEHLYSSVLTYSQLFN